LEKSEMKKTLVAMAVMAVAGAASAQVTLYGTVDAGLAYADVAGVTTTKMNSGVMNGSRWGVRGTEDLGGGLTARFQLENGFAIDNGTGGQGLATPGLNAGGTLVDTSVPRMFGRQALVGVSGSFGSVTVGRQYTPGDIALGIDAAGAQGVGGGGAMYTVFTSNFNNVDGFGAARADNSINYSLPAMGGVSGNLMVGLDESDVAGAKTNFVGNKFMGLNVGYAAGKIAFNVAWETQSKTNAAKSDTGWVAGASYDLGAAKVGIMFAGGTNTADTSDSGWSLGVGAPMGAVRLQASYARETSKATGATAEAVTTGWGGNVWYDLSKRSSVYVGLLNKEDQSAAGVVVKATHMAGGLRHTF
jgi:predicted porin